MAGVAFALASSALAADALFPRPLHIVRQVEDPVAGTTATLHEYCAGDQIVTVNGAHVAIADYAKQQLIEIDRHAGTYSVTRFDEMAKSNPAPRAQSPPQEWKNTPLGVKAAQSGRSLDAFELTREGVTIAVLVDPATRVSRAALEVLIGASWPNQRRDEHDAILQAAGASRHRDRRIAAHSAAAETDYALPFEQTLTIDADGDRITVRNTIIDLRSELVPAEVKLIPPGARQVESRTIRLVRELRDLDRLP